MASGSKADRASGVALLKKRIGMKHENVASLVGLCLSVVLMLAAQAPAQEAHPPDSVATSRVQSSSDQPVPRHASRANGSDALGAAASHLGVKWERGKLSVDVDGVPLAQVLQAVSTATGVALTGAEDLHGLVSAHFIETSLLAALQRLLEGFDYAIAAGPGSDSAQSAKVVILRKHTPKTPERARQRSEAELQKQISLAPVEATDQTIDSASDAIAADARAVAVEELSASLQDPGQPTRLEDPVLPAESPSPDPETLMERLRDALQNPVPASSSDAVPPLTERDGADTKAALQESIDNPRAASGVARTGRAPLEPHEPSGTRPTPPPPKHR